MTPHTSPRFQLLAFCLAGSLATASAADFNYVPNGTNTWNTAVWSSAAVPAPAHNYIVANGQTLRTTDGSSSIFGGASLTLAGQLNIQAGDGRSNSANLILQSGAVIVNARTGTQTIAGTLQLGTGTQYFKSTGTTGAGAARNITFDTLVSGGTNATAHFLRNGTFALGNAGNTFAGTWRAGGSASVQSDGPLATVSNESGVVSTIKATTTGSLGINASVALDAWSRFDTDFDWTTTGSLTLAANGGNASSIIVTLDQNITVGLLSIAGIQLVAGTYDYTELVGAGYGDYFTNGAGTITVAIPEPSTCAIILGLSTLALVTCSRRKNPRPSAASTMTEFTT
ncbi:MAG: anchor protein [Rariglobus sp.]|jgi:hypothetical protein|nr:anchor protein [Rariglobus sp.]